MNRILIAAFALGLGLAWSSALHASSHREAPGAAASGGCGGQPAAKIEVKRPGHAPSPAGR